MKTRTVDDLVATNGKANQVNDVEAVLVTPVLAAEWWAGRAPNRNYRKRVAAAYAIDMLNGDWRWNGETVKFDKQGRQIDGQHRTGAVMIAGETNPDFAITFLVVRGLDTEAQEDIDRGVPRRFHDVLAFREEPNANQLAALIRNVHGWNLGWRRHVNRTGNVTVAQLLRTLDAYPELRDLVVPARAVANVCALPPSIVGVAWWVFSQIDNQDADYFMARLGDGQGLMKEDPIYELRRTLQSTADRSRGERQRDFLLAITIKAWNAYRSGKSVQVLNWRAGGAKPESFPVPV